MWPWPSRSCCTRCCAGEHVGGAGEQGGGVGEHGGRAGEHGGRFPLWAHQRTLHINVMFSGACAEAQQMLCTGEAGGLISSFLLSQSVVAPCRLYVAVGVPTWP